MGKLQPAQVEELKRKWEDFQSGRPPSGPGSGSVAGIYWMAGGSVFWMIVIFSWLAFERAPFESGEFLLGVGLGMFLWCCVLELAERCRRFRMRRLRK
jgi:hypothetical protein